MLGVNGSGLHGADLSPGLHPELLPVFNTPALHTQDQPCRSSAKVSSPAALGSSPNELQQENKRPHLRVT